MTPWTVSWCEVADPSADIKWLGIMLRHIYDRLEVTGELTAVFDPKRRTGWIRLWSIWKGGQGQACLAAGGDQCKGGELPLGRQRPADV